MDTPSRQILMERRSMLPENICPNTGLPLRPPELVRSRQLGYAVDTTDAFVLWMQDSIGAYRSHNITPDGKTVIVACEVEDPYFNESLRLMDSSTESSLDAIFTECVHCAYHKVWRVTALYEMQTPSAVLDMLGKPSACRRLTSFLRCERANLKVYFVDLVQ